jgi:hypothetical protein
VPRSPEAVLGKKVGKGAECLPAALSGRGGGACIMRAEGVDEEGGDLARKTENGQVEDLVDGTPLVAESHD